VALSLGAGFVARVSVGNREQAKSVLKEAFSHRGYALIDIFQPCVTFNKLNTYAWFREHTRELEASHDSSDRLSALQKALESEPMPLGIFYQEKGVTFEERVRRNLKTPLYAVEHDLEKLQRMFEKY
jgi:2-oxoglutarate ferredoxin oxidoreductase subunit beta